MSVFVNIKEMKFQVERLKKQLPYIKDQKQLDGHIKLINTMILIMNDVEFMLEDKINTDAIDKLILARIYSQVFPLYKVSDKVDIKRIARNISDNIEYPKELLKDQIVDFLYHKEIDLELAKSAPDFTRITKKEEYEVMVYDLVEQLKESIQWN